VVLPEKETQALQRRLDGYWSEIVTSDLALTELVRVVRRSCYDSQRQPRVDETTLDQRLIAVGDLLQRIDRMTLNTDTLLHAGMFAGDRHLGSLDAIHLVSAMKIGPELRSFITYDRTLARVAKQADLPLEQPS
jgi:predicted nucleic acid-binding protein